MSAACIAALCAAALLRLCPVTGAQEGATRPPRVGVSGDYPNGIDGQLSARGLAWERVFCWELNQPEVLARYDVLMLSCIPEKEQGVDEALTQWLEAGGRAYVETWAAQSKFPLTNLIKIASGAPSQGDVIVTATDHPVAARVSQPVNMYHLQGMRVWPRTEEGTQIIAYYCTDEGNQAIQEAPAMVTLKVGAGDLLYSGAPVAFARFHRGRSAEPLMDGIIQYLLGSHARSRLLYTEPRNTAPAGSGERIVIEEEALQQETEAPEPITGPPPPPPPEPGTLPEGFELIDCLGDEAYNVMAYLGPTSGNANEPTTLALDAQFSDEGKPTRPCVWLTFAEDRIEAHVGKMPTGRALASSEWTPAEGAEILVRRRPGAISVVAGATEVLHADVKPPPGGAIAVAAGSVALVDPVCQPVVPPVFGEDFMREAGSPTPWTPVSGQWKNVGVGHEHFSINGFYYLGKGEGAALATAGDSFWEDYAVGASVRPNDEGTGVGLCALVQANGDYVALTADSASAKTPHMRLTRTSGGEESVLAESDGGLAHDQWYRLTIRLRDARIEGLVDGDQVLTCANPEPRGGGIGLLVRDGSARFDDVLLHASDEPLQAPRLEGRPIAEIPESMGPHDYMTWANPGTPWEAVAERPSLLRHTGSFFQDVDVSVGVRPVEEPSVRRLILAPTEEAPEDEWTSVALRLEPGAHRAELTGQAPRRKPATKQVSLQGDDTLTLSRADGAVTALWNGKPALRLGQASDTHHVGLEIEGTPVQAEDLTVFSPAVRDYVFGVAPTDWWASGGAWEVSARWACDNRWSWLAGWGSKDAAIWNKRPAEGNVALDFWAGVKMEAPGGPETQRCRDLNAVLCGDKSDARSGYSFVLGGDGNVKTQLLRNGEVVAEDPVVRVPAGYNIHHRWFHMKVWRIGNEIGLDFEGRPVIRFEDPDPLPGGYVGLWTRNSGVLIPRATMYTAGNGR